MAPINSLHVHVLYLGYKWSSNCFRWRLCQHAGLALNSIVMTLHLCCRMQYCHDAKLDSMCFGWAYTPYYCINVDKYKREMLTVGY